MKKNPDSCSDTTTPRKRRWTRYLVEAVLLVLVVVAVRAYQTRDAVQGPAPAFEAVLLDGTPVSLATFQDRPLLLHFWATWCPVCRVEQNNIQRLSEDHAVLTVSIDDMSAEKLVEWMVKQGVSYPVIPDPSSVLSRRYGINGVPTSIIIGADNQVRFIEVGYTTEIGLRLRLWWAGRSP
ncbi:Membrane protein, suppressor for copper-sensitivity ScsD [hydrothermal vent metagenome]|uniref:Membrane protein, suppressor for copper-sensitivity ScsD n=1 Tax=hydrothermal vent metagenome TaxID=652676 RepID=A0A3B0ZJN3_9ZZZZ